MLLILTLRIICCWDDYGFIATPSFPYSRSSHEVCGRRLKRLNVDRRKASVYGGRELLHRLHPIPGFSRDRRNPHPEEVASGNETDVEPEAEEECLWELNPLVKVLISSMLITPSMM